MNNIDTTLDPEGITVRVYHPKAPARVVMTFPRRILNWVSGTTGTVNNEQLLSFHAGATISILLEALPVGCTDPQAAALISSRAWEATAARMKDPSALCGLSFDDMLTLRLKFVSEPVTAEAVIELLKTLPSARCYDGVFEFFRDNHTPPPARPLDWNEFTPDRWGDEND